MKIIILITAIIMTMIKNNKKKNKFSQTDSITDRNGGGLNTKK